MSINNILPGTQLPGASKAPADKHGLSVTGKSGTGKSGAGQSEQARPASFGEAIARLPGRNADANRGTQESTAADALAGEVLAPQVQMDPSNSALAQPSAWWQQLVAEATISSESEFPPMVAVSETISALQLTATDSLSGRITAAADKVITTEQMAKLEADASLENPSLHDSVLQNASQTLAAGSEAAKSMASQPIAPGLTAQAVIATAGSEGKNDAGRQASATATAATAQLSSADLSALTSSAADASKLESTASTLTRIGDPDQATVRMSAGPDISPTHGVTGQAGSALSAGSTSATPGTPSPQVSAPLSSPQWGGELGQQLVNISRRGDQRVSLNLNPAELGPLTVELKVVDQMAQLQFLSGQPQVRQAVEQAIPQLREALAEQGISLGETSVGEQRNAREQFAQSGGSRSHQGSSTADELPPTDTSDATTSISAAAGRINLYV